MKKSELKGIIKQILREDRDSDTAAANAEFYKSAAYKKIVADFEKNNPSSSSREYLDPKQFKKGGSVTPATLKVGQLYFVTPGTGTYLCRFDGFRANSSEFNTGAGKKFKTERELFSHLKIKDFSNVAGVISGVYMGFKNLQKGNGSHIFDFWVSERGWVFGDREYLPKIYKAEKK